MHSLSQNTKTMRITFDGSSAYSVGAGTSAKTSEVVDTAGWRGIRFILAVGTLSSSNTTDFHIHGGATTSPTTDITGAAATQLTNAGTDSSKLAIIELIDSPYRYMKAVTTPAAGNGVLEALIVELFNPNGTVPDQTAATTTMVDSTTIVENV
jgi:hypothetical protein